MRAVCIVEHCQRPCPPIPKYDIAIDGRRFLKEEVQRNHDRKLSSLRRKSRKEAPMFEAERVSIS